MVTNSLTCVDKADLIVVLNEGKISESGTYVELLSHKGPLAVLLREYMKAKGEEDAEDETLMSELWLYFQLGINYLRFEYILRCITYNDNLCPFTTF